LHAPQEKAKKRRVETYEGRSPDIGTFPELVEYLFSVGPVLPSGMGSMPITWQELAAWQAVTGVELDAFEAEAVMQLSGAYAAMYEQARKDACPAPWVDPEMIDRDAVSRRVEATLMRFQAGRVKARRARPGGSAA